MGIVSTIKNISKSVIDIIDKAVVDKDLKKELKQKIEVKLLDHAETLEREITTRHELDMKSDSWLSKNIRPLTLAFLMLVFVIITFSDGNIGEFHLQDAYIPVYETLLSLVFTFYYGSRGAEKITKIYKEKS